MAGWRGSRGDPALAIIAPSRSGTARPSISAPSPSWPRSLSADLNPWRPIAAHETKRPSKARHVDYEIVLLLMLAATCAGFVDSVAGGGGLITLPALLLSGLTPVEAVATNKLQGTFGVASATASFWRAGHLDFRSLIPLI